MSRAGLILCGGRSRRMGKDKASLPFGDETLLERVAGTLGEVVDELWLVAREGQEVPLDLPVARDSAEGLGPLAGIAAGLRAMQSERAFLASCDTPLIQPNFVERMFELSEGHAAAVPLIEGHWMTTTAVYAKSLLPLADGLLADGIRRPRALFDATATRFVAAEELTDIDPELLSLRDCDTPEDYHALLALAGHRPHSSRS
jgi:molybdopterin-guanine dinucleotide biosynthesis protein A